jgi:hypothetical protein
MSANLAETNCRTERPRAGRCKAHALRCLARGSGFRDRGARAARCSAMRAPWNGGCTPRAVRSVLGSRTGPGHHGRARMRRARGTHAAARGPRPESWSWSWVASAVQLLLQCCRGAPSPGFRSGAVVATQCAWGVRASAGLPGVFPGAGRTGAGSRNAGRAPFLSGRAFQTGPPNFWPPNCRGEAI